MIDHILAARFLSRFTDKDFPWIHLDLAAGKHQGGPAQIPSDTIGFGGGCTLAFLRRHRQ